jgi:hypothetical protein
MEDGETQDEYSITLKRFIDELFPEEHSYYSNNITAFHKLQLINFENGG